MILPASTVLLTRPLDRRFSRSNVLAIFAVAVFVLALHRYSLGIGFEVPNQGAAATGQAEAFVAQADDPSAVYYNPAGLTQLRGTQVQAGVYSIWLNNQFRSDLGDAEMNAHNLVPHLYLVSDAGSERFRVGVGINNCFGLGIDWGENSSVAPVVQYADLSVLAVSPVVALRVSPNLSVAGGLNCYIGSLDTRRALSADGSLLGDARLDGDGMALGYTVAAMYSFSKRHQIGVVYRSGFDLELEGSIRTSFGTQQNTVLELQLPPTARAGYAFWPNEVLKLEIDVAWSGWERLGTVPIRSDGVGASQAIVFDYEDSYFLSFGVQYILNDSWVLRSGYCYGTSSVPDSAFSPLNVDPDYHIFAVGLGYSTTDWKLDLAYQYIFREDRVIEESVNSFPGQFDDQTHAVMATLTLLF